MDLYKGTIIENSLADKNILASVKIEKTYQSDDWIIHDVCIKKWQIPEIAKALAEGPWYAHLSQPGSDDVIVIFKNKTFTIKYSDASTWTGAVAYGKSIGIPEEQLDFPIRSK